MTKGNFKMLTLCKISILSFKAKKYTYLYRNKILLGFSNVQPMELISLIVNDVTVFIKN